MNNIEIVRLKRLIEGVQKQHSCLLSAAYLCEEVQCCDQFLRKHPEHLGGYPSQLANSARLLLLCSKNTVAEHKELPLFNGYSENELLSGTSVDPLTKHIYEGYRKYKSTVGKEVKEVVLPRVTKQKKAYA